MTTSTPVTPSIPLSTVRQLIRQNKIDIKPNALTGTYSLGWNIKQMKKCLMKLSANQCYNTERHRKFPTAMVDKYRAFGIMQKKNVYTHFYIHPVSGDLTINSFHRL